MINYLPLAHLLANTALFLEFTKEPMLDNRIALKAMEQMAVDAQAMMEDDRRELCTALRIIASNYGDSAKAFVFDLPYTLGIDEDYIDEDDTDE